MNVIIFTTNSRPVFWMLIQEYKNLLCVKWQCVFLVFLVFLAHISSCNYELQIKNQTII